MIGGDTRATPEGVLFYTGITAGVMTLEQCSEKSRSAKTRSTTLLMRAEEEAEEQTYS